MSENEPERTRKPYTPPQLEEVELEPEEALTAGCKLLASGPSGGNCIIENCVLELGS